MVLSVSSPKHKEPSVGSATSPATMRSSDSRVQAACFGGGPTQVCEWCASAGLLDLPSISAVGDRVAYMSAALSL